MRGACGCGPRRQGRGFGACHSRIALMAFSFPIVPPERLALRDNAKGRTGDRFCLGILFYETEPVSGAGFWDKAPLPLNARRRDAAPGTRVEMRTPAPGSPLLQSHADCPCEVMGRSLFEADQARIIFSEGSRFGAVQEIDPATGRHLYSRSARRGLFLAEASGSSKPLGSGGPMRATRPASKPRS